MALPASHLRFAAAVRPSIRDRSAYFSGTVYPDSRWISGIDREATHGRQCLATAFATDDFTLGWHLHCLCDQLQGEIHQPLIPGLSDLAADERWIMLTAAKVIQDMHDAARADLGDLLSYLSDSRAPNGESSADVSAYLAAVRHAYRSGTTPAWADYEQLWRQVGLDRKTIGRIAQAAADLERDAAIVKQLHGAFRQMTAALRITGAGDGDSADSGGS